MPSLGVRQHVEVTLGQVQTGDLFREVGGAARLWRVVAVHASTYELQCVKAPNLSRFATREKLFDRSRYLQAMSPGEAEGMRFVSTADSTA